MGRIDAPLGEIAGVGAGIESLASSLGGLSSPVRAAGGGVADPPATAAGLEALSARWTTAAQRLEDELATLGVATQATAVAYRAADEQSMGGGGRVLAE
jgi:hypothetical protein